MKSSRLFFAQSSKDTTLQIVAKLSGLNLSYVLRRAFSSLLTLANTSTALCISLEEYMRVKSTSW